MRNFVYILFIMFFGVFGINTAQAQFSLPQTEINVEMFPNTPGPNQEVYVSLTSYATNINTANITWRINDKIKKFGIGERAFNFFTGAMNTTTTLEITIETREGEIIEKIFKIKPVSIDLIWESEGFVPPFYKGKTLFSHQNKITFIALPHILSSNGAEIGVKNLVYTWKKNGSVIESVSGYGKNTYSFVSPLISRPFNVEVEITTINNDGSGHAIVSLNPAEPSVIFYKKDPLYGIQFQKALQNTIQLNSSKEIAVIGIPLFFGTINSTYQDLYYKWSVNGVPINNAPEQSVQVFRQIGGTKGTSNISLSVENTNKILQYASNNFNLMFGE